MEQIHRSVGVCAALRKGCTGVQSMRDRRGAEVSFGAPETGMFLDTKEHEQSSPARIHGGTGAHGEHGTGLTREAGGGGKSSHRTKHPRTSVFLLLSWGRERRRLPPVAGRTRLRSPPTQQRCVKHPTHRPARSRAVQRSLRSCAGVATETRWTRFLVKGGRARPQIHMLFESGGVPRRRRFLAVISPGIVCVWTV